MAMFEVCFSQGLGELFMKPCLSFFSQGLGERFMKHQILFNFLCVTFQGFGFSDLHLIGSKGFFRTDQGRNDFSPGEGGLGS